MAKFTSGPFAVVTGASSGIGHELAKQFGEPGSAAKESKAKKAANQ